MSTSHPSFNVVPPSFHGVMGRPATPLSLSFSFSRSTVTYGDRVKFNEGETSPWNIGEQWFPKLLTEWSGRFEPVFSSFLFLSSFIKCTRNCDMKIFLNVDSSAVDCEWIMKQAGNQGLSNKWIFYLITRFLYILSSPISTSWIFHVSCVKWNSTRSNFTQVSIIIIRGNFTTVSLENNLIKSKEDSCLLC